MLEDNRMTRLRKTTATLAVALGATLGCGPQSAQTGTSETSDGTSTTSTSISESESESQTGTQTETEDEPVVGWFDIGFGEQGFEPIEHGGEMHIVWGSQGAAMFPMPIRAGEFVLPDDPRDFTDERAPILELTVDIEGFNSGVGGHFKRIANYPIAFDILPDGTYEFIYVRVIVPDTIDPADLDGLPAHVWVQLDPWGSAPLTIEYDLVARVDPPPF
jgi:hypothetical protein